MKGTTYKRCACKDPDTGKPLNQHCPRLTERRHGTWGWMARLDTTEKPGREIKRAGYSTKTAAGDALERVQQLVKLAADDDRLRRKIGDLIFERSKRGGELPSLDDVRRKLGAGVDVDSPTMSVGAWLEEWYAGKRSKKVSTLRGWRQHMDHYLIPILGEIPLNKLRVEHIAGMFDTIEEWNSEIQAARDEHRPPNLPDDVRARKKLVGIASQHRVLQTLRNALNVAMKPPRRLIDFNPVLGVELPPEERDAARVWSPEQVVTFFEATENDRLGLLFRIVLLRGLRRGEACGLRWSDLDLTTGHATIAQTVLQLGGRIVLDTPKTRKSKRVVSLDSETTKLVKGHHGQQREERFAAGPAYVNNDLVFCREDGRPLSPDGVSARFKALAAAAGLPVIKLHEARHTAATLALEAEIDIKIVSDQLGHSTTRITQDLYTHVRQAVHDKAAEKVLNFLPERKSGARTGS